MEVSNQDLSTLSGADPPAQALKAAGRDNGQNARTLDIRPPGERHDLKFKVDAGAIEEGAC